MSEVIYNRQFSHFTTYIIVKTLCHREGVVVLIIKLWAAGVHHYIGSMVFIIIELVYNIGGRQGACGMH